MPLKIKATKITIAQMKRLPERPTAFYTFNGKTQVFTKQFIAVF